MTPVTPIEYIWSLAYSFPCLRSKLPAKRPDTFDPDAFYGRMCGWSHGEFRCGLFVLNVWNPYAARSKGWTFDLMDFVGSASARNLEPVTNWILNPYFP